MTRWKAFLLIALRASQAAQACDRALVRWQ
jgi:hypothetical protein